MRGIRKTRDVKNDRKMTEIARIRHPMSAAVRKKIVKTEPGRPARKSMLSGGLILREPTRQLASSKHGAPQREMVTQLGSGKLSS